VSTNDLDRWFTMYLVLHPEDDLLAALLFNFFIALSCVLASCLHSFSATRSPPVQTHGAIARVPHLTITATNLLPQLPSILVAFGVCNHIAELSRTGPTNGSENAEQPGELVLR
jgi:hypothetical protein